MSAGILSQVSLGKETTQGTAVTPTMSIPVLPCDGLSVEEEAVGVEAINTQPAKNKDFIKGLRKYVGSIEMGLYPQSIGYVLLSALGSVSSAVKSGETNVYEHTFTENVDKPSLTLEQKVGDIVERYAGFISSGFTVDITTGEQIKFTFEGNALSKADATAITPTYEASKVFDWTDVQSITLGGTDIKDVVSELSIEYANGLDVFHGLKGSSDPSKLYVANSEVTGSITAFLDSNIQALRDVFENKTEQSLVITIKGDETIGSASNNELVITLPMIVLNTYTHKLDTGYVEVSSDIVGGLDKTNGLISIKLTNEVSAY